MSAPSHYRIVHRTAYEYERSMSDGYTIAHLLPRPTPSQVVEHAEVTVEPVPDERAEHTDLFGNRVLQLGVHHSHRSLVLVASSEVVVEPFVLGDAGPPWEDVRQGLTGLRGGEALSVRPFAASSPYVPLDRLGDALRALAEPAFRNGRPIIAAAADLCARIDQTFEYDSTFSEISTPLAAVLDARRGVCQDFAHLAAGCLRALGLAARYVSGYIETEPRRGVAAPVGGDASHAWCSVWTGPAGWVDFDPTNGHLPTDRHATVAWGRDYGDVTPVRGVVIGPPSRQSLTVEVRVERVGPTGV